jgi:hypothetical protein
VKYYQKCLEGLIKNKMVDKYMEELPKQTLVRLLAGWSVRIDQLERFITSNTKYDGSKVHNKQGGKKKDWVKDENEERKGDIKSNKAD